MALKYSHSAQIGTLCRSMRKFRNDLSGLVRVNNEESYIKREEIIKNNKNLYIEIINLLSNSSGEQALDKFAELEKINEHMHDSLVKYGYEQYTSDVSTLLNVMSGIYSSNKAFSKCCCIIQSSHK